MGELCDAQHAVRHDIEEKITYQVTERSGCKYAVFLAKTQINIKKHRIVF